LVKSLGNKGRGPGWEIFPRAEDSLYSVLGREKHKSHVGERGNHKSNILYKEERSIQCVHTIFRMYVGCNGNNRIHMHVVVGTITYIHTNASRKGQVYIG
jgi:hypothetical protein